MTDTCYFVVQCSDDDGNTRRFDADCGPENNSQSSLQCSPKPSTAAIDHVLDQPSTSAPCSKKHRSQAKTDHDNNQGKNGSQPTKIKHLFREQWKDKWHWLSYDGHKMICSLCKNHNKENTFTSGCTNFRTSTLERHVMCHDHQSSLKAEALAKDFTQAANAAVKKSASEPGLVAAMRTVFWMGQEDLPIKKYPSLVEFLKLQGCDSLKQISIAGNATYGSRQSGKEFQESVATVIHDSIIKKIKQAKMLAILIDESTDISVSKQMVVYARVVDENFNVCTHLLKNICISDPKSDAKVLYDSLFKYLVDEEIDIGKLKGFGSDGAAVMVGKRSGVATRLKEVSPHCVNIHCMAHRFNLCTSQASKNVTYVKEFEKILTDLFYYFGGSKSGNRKCELEEIQKILDDPQVKMKQCHEIRWIACYEAVHSIYKTWTSLVTFFKKHPSDKNFLEKLTNFKFLTTLYMMMDILPSVAQMSMSLQKQDVDVATVTPVLQGLKDKIKLAEKGDAFYQKEFQVKLEKIKDDDGKTKEVKFKGQKLVYEKTYGKDVKTIRKDFCANLIRNIDERFPKDDISVAMAFGVLSMRPLTFLSETDRDSYGNKEMEILLQHYGNVARKGEIVSLPLIDSEQCRLEWSTAKKIVYEQKYPRDKTSTLMKLLFDFHRETLPNLMTLANLALIMPYQTADCERGFSCQNGIKTARRSRLKESHLNTLMTIKIEGGNIQDFDFGQAINLWKNKKKRKICQKMS